MSKAMRLKTRMKNLALKNNIPAQAVLQNFMLERLLERISAIRHDEIISRRWQLYASENYYARGIEFGAVMDVVKRLIG